MSEELNINLNELKADDEHIFDQKIIDEVNSIDTPPLWASENWHEYVMRQFTDDELDGGKPIRDGLVRVSEKLIGPMVSRKVVNFSAPSDSNRGTSTVHMRLKFLVTNEAHPLYNEYLTEDGIAEVNSRNTPAPFHMHPSASASSKAEAQALRKVLRLRKMVAADEVTPDDMVLDGDVYMPEVPIVEEQITVIDLLCKRTNNSVLDFINSGQSKYVFVEQIPSSKAQTMIKFLNEIQSGKKESPIKKAYDPAWREKNYKRANRDESPTESQN